MENNSSITVGAILDSYTNNKGQKQVYIRITQNKRHKKIKLGLLVLNSEWSGIYGKWVNAKNPEHAYYNSKIQAKLTEIQKAHLNLQDSPTKGLVNKEAVYKEATKANLRVDFIKYWETKEAQMENYNQSKGYVTTRNKIIAFIGSEKIEYREINFEWLTDFERHLKTQGLDSDSVYTHQKRIRAIYNKGIKEGVFELQYYPFRVYKMPKVEENEIEKLDTDELQSLFALEYRPDELKFWVHNGFQLSFHCTGIRIEDLLTLKWSNIRFGRLTYQMKKGVTNGKIKTFEIAGGLATVLDALKKADAHNTGYVLPFLNKGDENLSSEKYKKQIGRKTSLFNKYLKKIADDACLSKNLKSHLARHSWAAYAYEETNDIRFIKENLGHNDFKTTEGYIGRLSSSKNDALIRRLDITQKKRKAS
jgi:integrase/recombinase XerD